MRGSWHGRERLEELIDTREAVKHGPRVVEPGSSLGLLAPGQAGVAPELDAHALAEHGVTAV